MEHISTTIQKERSYRTRGIFRTRQSAPKGREAESLAYVRLTRRITFKNLHCVWSDYVEYHPASCVVVFCFVCFDRMSRIVDKRGGGQMKENKAAISYMMQAVMVRVCTVMKN